jgi:hypothetical protein
MKLYVFRTVPLSIIRSYSLYTRQWYMSYQWRTQEFFSGGVQQIQLRTEDRENGDLGAVAP